MPKLTQKDKEEMFFLESEYQKSNHDLYVKLGEKENTAIFKACGFHGTRVDTMAAIFRFYLMSRKENRLDFYQAGKMLPGAEGFEENFKEFVDFCKANPVQGNLTEKAKENSINAWTNVFKNATETMASYKMPKIDYGDPRQVNENAVELGTLVSNFINFSQEFAFFRSGLKKDAEKVKNAAGGEKALSDMLYKWDGLGYVMQPLQHAYMPLNLDEYSGDTLEKYLETIATQRYVLQEISKNISGKKFGELTENTKPKDLYSANAYMKLRSDILANQDKYPPERVPHVRSYLKNQKNDIEKEFAYNLKEAINSNRREYNNGRIGSAVSKFGSHLTEHYCKDLADNMKKLFDGNPSADELVNRIQSKDFDKLRFQVDYVFDKTFNSSHHDRIYALMKDRPVDSFLIDGKSPNELWGKKYESVTDPLLKERMLKTEVIKEAVLGDKNISCSVWYLNKNNKPHKSRPIQILNSKEYRDRKTAYLIGVHELHNELVKIQGKLLLTQDDKQANLPGYDKQTGSKLYRTMFSALNKCLKATEIRNNRVNVNDLQKALAEYHKASKKYYERRKGIFFAPRGEGKKRLDLSKSVTDSLLDKAERLKLLAGGLDLTPRVFADAYTYHSNAYMLTRQTLYEPEKKIAARGGAVSYLKVNKDVIDVSDQGKEMYEQHKLDADIRVRKKNALRESLKDRLAKMVFEDEKLRALDELVFASEQKPVSACAKRQVADKYLELINDPTATMEKLEKIEKNIEPDKLQKEVVELIKSPVFQEVTSKSPRSFKKKWNKINEEADVLKDSFDNQKTRLKEELSAKSEDLSEEKLSQMSKAEKNDLFVNVNYKIGTLIATQILTEIQNKDIMRAVAADGNNYKAVVDAAVDFANKNNLAAKGNLQATLQEGIDSGAFKNEVIKNLSGKSTENTKKAEKDPMIRKLVEPHIEMDRKYLVPGM